jgi:hypothetical protein
MPRRFVKPLNFLSFVVERILLAALVLLLPFLPLGYALVSGRFHFLRNYRLTLKRAARYLHTLWRLRVVSRNLRRVLAGSTFPSESIEGSCTHCGRCCVDRTCLFLGWDAQGRSICTIYNNWFWKLTPCGSYPVDRASIDVYGCPSFKAVPIKRVPIKLAVARADQGFNAENC